MNPALQNLVHLQNLELEMIALESKSKKIPSQIEELDQTLQESRLLQDQIQEAIENEHAQRRQLEREVQDLQAKLSKFRSQLMEVKTNKEYQAVLQEVANAEGRISSKEDKILERMMAVDEWQKKARETKAILEGKEKEVLAQRKELESFTAQAETEITRLQEQQQQVKKLISAELMEQYRRIASARQGVALAAVVNQSCQACHVKLRPQLAADIRSNSQIITCENCNRILYYPVS
ncbi:MAG: zinc ribbon domain-containing protein [Acidobacteriota bacterium]